MLSESNRACPKCGAVHAFEWVDRSNTGWCLVCGYFEHYESYTRYLDNPDEDGPELLGGIL
jgi:ribosomal protein S27AE